MHNMQCIGTYVRKLILFYITWESERMDFFQEFISKELRKK